MQEGEKLCLFCVRGNLVFCDQGVLKSKIMEVSKDKVAIVGAGPSL